MSKPFHRHKAEKPAIIRQVVDNTIEVFKGEPRNYSGPLPPEVIYGHKCECGEFMALTLCTEARAKELAQQWNAEHADNAIAGTPLPQGT